jgi:hypothetical protein
VGIARKTDEEAMKNVKATVVSVTLILANVAAWVLCAAFVCALAFALMLFGG